MSACLGSMQKEGSQVFCRRRCEPFLGCEW